MEGYVSGPGRKVVLGEEVMLAGKLEYLWGEPSNALQGTATWVGRGLSGLLRSLDDTAAKLRSHDQQITG